MTSKDHPDNSALSTGPDASAGPIAPGAIIDLVHLADANQDGIAVFDSAGTFLFVNRAAESILSEDRANLLGRTVWSLLPKLASADSLFLQHFESAVNERIDSSYEAYSPSVLRWLNVRLVPCSGHKSVSGDDRGVTVYFRDVTEQVEAKRRHAKSETQFRLMANGAPVLIWTTDIEGRCNWLNESWLRFTGRSMEDELGNGWMEGIHPDNREACNRTFAESFRVRVPFTMEYRLRHFDGQYRWMLDNGVPLLASDGTFGGYIGSCIDVSEQRNFAERQRRFVREMLASVTEGKLCLCESEADITNPLPPVSDAIELTAETLRHLRKRVEAVAESLHLGKDRIQDLVTAVGEAGMNAVRHGGGGFGRIHADPEKQIVQVWITDRGKGIRQEDLHRATLEKGWSGADSFGHGFFLMLRTVDRTYLLTSAEGTTVVVEQERTAPKPTWF